MSIKYRRAFMFFIAAGALAFAAPGCTPPASDEPGGGASDVEAKNEAVVRLFMDEVLMKGNVAMIDSLVAPDFVDHNAPPGLDSGIAGMRKWVPEMHAGMPDGKIEVLEVFTNGDLAATHVRQTGTNTGPMMGMPATGKKMDVRGVDVVRLRDGKAIEHWGYWEEMKMMQQMGMMPEGAMPGAPPATPGAATDTAAPATDTTAK